MNKNVIIMAVAVIIVGAGGFFGGMKYQQNKQPAFFRQFGGEEGIRMGVGDSKGFLPVNGEIIAADEKSITVKLQDGSSKIVLLSDKTEINKTASTTKEDLKVGEKVAAFGTENSDGSVTAQSVQLNPRFRGIEGP